MKKFATVLVVLGLLALGGQSFAEMCAIDPVPAATLLLPYFEVDTAADPGVGRTTLFSVNNASAAPTIAHVTIWSNWSVPIIDFDIYLTGFDVQTVNMYDIIVSHVLPRTADPAGDGADTISPHAGAFADNPMWDDVTFGGLSTGACPLPYPAGAIGATAADRLDGLTGDPLNSGACVGDPIEAGLAVGYVTIDDVNACNLLFPNAPGYFVNGGVGTASNDNQLWGDFFIVDPANNFAQAENLVHIEADDFFTAESTPTNYTFYGRFTLGACLGCDNREPLGTTWAPRYINGGVFDGTDFLVWRDSTSSNANDNGVSCASGPDWFAGVGLNEVEVIAFNEAEDAVRLCQLGPGGVISPPEPGSDDACFPYETQRVPVGGPGPGRAADLVPPFNFGWMYLNLNVGLDAFASDVDFGSDTQLAQSWVGQIHSAAGRYSGGYTAVELTSACDDLNPTLYDVWCIGEPGDPYNSPGCL
jgi:hypothetical protein